MAKAIEVVGRRWHLTLTLSFENYFRTFLIQAIPFQRHVATLCSVQRYIFRIFRSRFSFKVMGLTSRSRQRKSGSVHLKNYWSKIAGA